MGGLRISIINNGEVLQDSKPRLIKCLPTEPASARRFMRFTGQRYFLQILWYFIVWHLFFFFTSLSYFTHKIQ